MSKTVYQISGSNPQKFGNKDLYGACFSSFGLAADSLRENGFEYSEEAELWHNGATEAWILRRPVRDRVIMLGVEEVQLR